jgi:hypothetical protein
LGSHWKCLALPHFRACLKPQSGFPIPYLLAFFVFNDLRWEVVISFVDICWPSLFKLAFHNTSCDSQILFQVFPTLGLVMSRLIVLQIGKSEFIVDGQLLYYQGKFDVFEEWDKRKCMCHHGLFCLYWVWDEIKYM